MNWVRDHQELFACPRCGNQMAVEGGSLVCTAGHRFDFNKHGYLYFLANKSNDEYSREMLLKRRQVLSAGLFHPMVAAVAAALKTGPQTILDVGTGEGTPLAQLAALRGGQDQLVGFDISRAGIQLATQLDLAAFFCVANLRQLPFQDGSFTSLIEFFSPSDYREFSRVLAPGGTLVKVIPNAGYLKELRALLYESVSAHASYDNQAVVDRFFANYPTGRAVPVRYVFKLAPELRGALVEMSPLHWGRDARSLTAADLAELTAVTVDVTLLIGEK